MAAAFISREIHQVVQVSAGSVELNGNLDVPADAQGLVLFAHGSGSSRFSRRNRFVAGQLQQRRLATLLIDLLTAKEEAADQNMAHLRFDIGMLAERLVGATDWLAGNLATADLPLGYFGASTGGAAALVAAADRPERVRAIVSRGGRPDLAARALPRVQAPTLLIVGGDDDVVIDLNAHALTQMLIRERRLVIVPGATHLFEEPGKLEEVARLAGEWFEKYLSK